MAAEAARGDWSDWPLEPLEILKALEGHDVRYIVIGGFAAVLHGSPLPTYDLDVTPLRDRRNLRHLQRALQSLTAEVYGDGSWQAIAGPDLEDALTGESSIATRTPYGMLDIEFEPAGTGGYKDLHRRAESFDIGDGLTVCVASLLDVVRSKETAHREGDVADLVALRALLELASGQRA